MMENFSLESVERILETFRPYLQRDGGDYQLMAVTADGVVQIKLLGACEVCPSSELTLKLGLEVALAEKLIGFKKIEQVF